MRRSWSLEVVLAVMAVCAASPARPAAEPAQQSHAGRGKCGDLLAALGGKPAHLSFLGCRFLPERQGEPFRATYRVTGRHAASVEAALSRAFAMERLKRICCHWGTQEMSFRRAGREYSIVMVSDETLARTRAEWRDIPIFEVVVQRYTAEI